MSRMTVLSFVLWTIVGVTVGGATSCEVTQTNPDDSNNTQKPVSTATPTPTPESTALPTPNPSATPMVFDMDVGVAGHLHDGDGHKLMKNIGVKWVRVDFNWDIAEAQKGQWNWKHFDDCLNKAKSAGLNVYANIGYTPAWASTTGKFTGPPQNISDWENYVRAVVTRYKKDIKYWGIWNEPNLEVFWTGTTDQYIDLLLKPASKVIRSIDSSLKIGAPDLAMLQKATISPWDFLKRIKDVGADKDFDFIAHHAYGTPFSEKILGQVIAGIVIKMGVKQVVESSGILDKPIWITEFGWDSAKDGEPSQANNISSALKLMNSVPWIDKAFIYEMHDDPGIPEKFGLLKFDLAPKPSYNEVRKVIFNQ